MSDDGERNEPKPHDRDPGAGAGQDELGEPIGELKTLSWSADDRFGARVTGRIERRLLTSRLLDVAFTAPLVVLLELLRAPFESLSRNRRS